MFLFILELHQLGHPGGVLVQQRFLGLVDFRSGILQAIKPFNFRNKNFDLFGDALQLIVVAPQFLKGLPVSTEPVQHRAVADNIRGLPLHLLHNDIVILVTDFFDPLFQFQNFFIHFFRSSRFRSHWLLEFFPGRRFFFDRFSRLQFPAIVNYYLAAGTYGRPIGTAEHQHIVCGGYAAFGRGISGNDDFSLEFNRSGFDVAIDNQYRRHIEPSIVMVDRMTGH